MDFKTTIYHFCNYQERCHSEVRNKLYNLGARVWEVEQLITQLIEDDLLNEERFAKSYARGHFYNKKWGRIKISQQLKLRKISDYCIRKGMKEIDCNDYYQCLEKLCSKKWAELKTERSETMKKMKVQRYLLQKGYEHDLILSAIREVIERERNN